MIYTRLHLPWGLWLARWLGFSWLVARVISLFSVLLLQRHWGRKRLVFWRLRRVVQRGKIIPMVPLCYFAATYTGSPQCYISGTSLRTPSNIVPVGWYRFFKHFVAFCCYLWHPCSPQFASNLLTCCAMWTRSMRIQCAFNSIYFGCTSKPDYNELLVNAPWILLSRRLHAAIHEVVVALLHKYMYMALMRSHICY